MMKFLFSEREKYMLYKYSIYHCWFEVQGDKQVQSSVSLINQSQRHERRLLLNWDISDYKDNQYPENKLKQVCLGKVEDLWCWHLPSDANPNETLPWLGDTVSLCNVTQRKFFCTLLLLSCSILPIVCCYLLFKISCLPSGHGGAMSKGHWHVPFTWVTGMCLLGYLDSFQIVLIDSMHTYSSSPGVWISYLLADPKCTDYSPFAKVDNGCCSSYRWKLLFCTGSRGEVCW